MMALCEHRGICCCISTIICILEFGEDDAGRPGVCFENATQSQKESLNRGGAQNRRRLSQPRCHGQHVHLRDSLMPGLSSLGKDKNLVGVAEARNERRYWVNLTRDRCKFVASERSAR
jgi:hypothetical protein